MRSKTINLLLPLSLLLSTHLAGSSVKVNCTTGSQQENHVTELSSPEQFDKALKDHKYVALKLYTDWCGMCPAIVKPFAQAAAKNTNIAAYSANAEGALKNRLAEYNVTCYPIILFFKDGKKVAENRGAVGNADQDFSLINIKMKTLASGGSGTPKNGSYFIEADDSDDEDVKPVHKPRKRRGQRHEEDVKTTAIPVVDKQSVEGVRRRLGRRGLPVSRRYAKRSDVFAKRYVESDDSDE